MQKHVVKRGFASYSAVELKSGDSIGLGMVREGTKCGPNKVRCHFPCLRPFPDSSGHAGC